MPLLLAIPLGLGALGFAGWGLSEFMAALNWAVLAAVALAAMYFIAKYVGVI